VDSHGRYLCLPCKELDGGNEEGAAEGISAATDVHVRIENTAALSSWFFGSSCFDNTIEEAVSQAQCR
jgi:hypothetical protein